MASSEVERLKELLIQKELQLLISRAELSQAMVDHFGEEAEMVIKRYLKDSIRDWAAKAAEADKEANKENDIQGLIEFLWDPLQAEGFEFTYEQDGQAYQFHVTRCPVAEIARSLGLEKWGYVFHCAGDYPICEGYNPSIEMTRTKTLMEGDEYCNHRYAYRE